jgi:hypothetical protein
MLRIDPEKLNKAGGRVIGDDEVGGDREMRRHTRKATSITEARVRTKVFSHFNGIRLLFAAPPVPLGAQAFKNRKRGVLERRSGVTALSKIKAENGNER